jgi:K+-sensing histidine kinase KdpD
LRAAAGATDGAALVNNLMDNALRYAGQARIELQDQREQLLIRVIDHGRA